jgi:hypothetical protein
MRIKTVQQTPIKQDAPQPGLKPPRPFAQKSPSAQQGGAQIPSAVERAARYGHNFARGDVRATESAPAREGRNETGLPDKLKAGVERLSGLSLDDVHVRYNSPAPARYRAHAHTRGTEIHLGPGQERHLAHEAWHVVQQKQGRVQPTMQMTGGAPVNDDAGLEREADVMGAKASAHAVRIKDAPEGQPAPSFSSAAAGPAHPSQRSAPRLAGHDAPVQGKWIIRRGERVHVPDDYVLRPGESTSEGLRRRVLPSQPAAPAPAVRRQPGVSRLQRLDQVGSLSGNIGLAASAAEHIHANPISEAVAHVPILGAVSSANTAAKKRQQSEQAYQKGHLDEAARHGVGAVASGIKSASDAATVFTGGLSAPLTVPVSAVASVVNTVTSLPEHAQTASAIARDPLRVVSQGLAAASRVPAILSSMGSAVSESAPAPRRSDGEQRLQEEHEPLPKAKDSSSAKVLKWSKRVINKRD